MKSPRSFFWVIPVFLLILPLLFADEPEVFPETETTGDAIAWVIPIEGDITRSMATFVRREARRAIDQGAEYLIFEIDTFGGRVDSSLQITSFMMSIRGITTIAWVRNTETSMGVSWSAGALIALACSQIYMANGTSIGAAAPVAIGPDGSTEGTGEKTVAAIRSQIAALAERNGHPTGIALAMVDYDIELWEIEVDGAINVVTAQELERLESLRPGQAGAHRELRRIGIISEEGKLLSLTAGEAFRYGLTRGMADDRDELLGHLGDVRIIEESFPSTWDSIISFLISGPVQGALILLGLVLLFLELQSPGFAIPGTLAIVCFILVFGSSFMLGRVGSLEIILFIIGLGLLAVELFLLPGFGIIGISGIIVIALSLILSMQDFVIPRASWEWTLMGRNVIVVFAGLIAAIAGIAIIALLGPKTRMFDPLTLKTQISQNASEGGGWKNDGGVESDYIELVGKTGKALTILRPIGKAEIESNSYQVEADGSFVDAGEEIKVVKIQGNNIIVRRV